VVADAAITVLAEVAAELEIPADMKAAGWASATVSTADFTVGAGLVTSADTLLTKPVTLFDRMGSEVLFAKGA
jgi:hypothetical protein